jgi:hypothetical protein
MVLAVALVLLDMIDNDNSGGRDLLLNPHENLLGRIAYAIT